MKLFLAAFFVMTTPIVARPHACQQVFSKPSLQSLPWRGTYDDAFMAFRSNAPHFWAWLKSQQSPVLQARGIVSGDPHILNFGDVLLKDGQRKYALVDVDDAGVRAPLAGDLLRYVVSNQVSPFKIKTADLIEAYRDGLAGQHHEKPELLKELENRTSKDNRKAQEKYLRKLTDGDKFSEKANVTPLPQTSPEVQRFFQGVERDLRLKADGYEILDVGYRSKSTGGSQGLARFWFLLRKDSEMHIWEFKEQGVPATGEYLPQGPHQERVQQVIDTYRPSDTYGPYEVVSSGDHSFLLRERTATSLDFDPAKMKSENDIRDGKELSLYLAYKLGRWHSQQPAAKDLETTLGTAKGREELTHLAEHYIDLIKNEMRP